MLPFLAKLVFFSIVALNPVRRQAHVNELGSLGSSLDFSCKFIQNILFYVSSGIFLTAFLSLGLRHLFAPFFLLNAAILSVLCDVPFDFDLIPPNYQISVDFCPLS